MSLSRPQLIVLSCLIPCLGVLNVFCSLFDMVIQSSQVMPPA